MKSIHTLLAIAALGLSAMQLSCNVNDYCLNCGTGDGGMDGDGDAMDGGGEIDAPPDAGCIPTGTEICDGVDNDCNGLIDDGVLPMVDELCDQQNGVCAGGTKICEDGQIKCTKNPSPEICDGLDNNCNGMIDEGDPGGGGKCGTDLGECVAGTLRCQATSGCDGSLNCDPLTQNCCVQCTNFVDRRSDPELCNGKDDNCNGLFDEGLSNLGACTWQGATNVGECSIGTLSCVGGNPQCNGAVFPVFEVCNNLDDDCDGNTDEIFNKNIDPRNCGSCNTVCPTPSMTCVGGTNARMVCSNDSQCPGSTCVVNSQPCCGPGCVPARANGTCGFKCNVGFIDLNNNPADGCEYKCSPTGTEECDGIDNNCNGLIDEGLTAPAGLCLSGGECGGGESGAECNNAIDDDADGLINDGCPAVGTAETGAQCLDAIDNDGDGFVNDGCPISGPLTVPTCMGSMGWRCNYPGTTEFPEVSCDDKNNDCDSNIDEGFPTKGQACNDGEPGVCLDEGTQQCTADGTGVICVETTNNPDLNGMPSLPGVTEDCNALDDDCDGNVDEDLVTGFDWVNIGNGKQMMKYEASRPDATNLAQGVGTQIACSKQSVLPWTNISYPQAQAACAAIGASLCTESQWHHTCSVVPPPTYPIAASTAAATFIEAEDYSGITFATGGTPNITRSWVPDYTTGFSSISAMEAVPNTATGSVAIADAAAQAPRMDYLVNFTQTSASYHVWVKMFQTSGAANVNTVYVGVNAGVPPQPPTATVTLPTATVCTPGGTQCNAVPGTTCQDTNGDAVVDSCVGWVWRDAGVFDVNAVGNRTVSIYMGTDGARVDKIAINTSATAPTDVIATKGNTWAYETNANVYAPMTCNGQDFSTANDDLVPTGSLASCFATTGSGVFDMSGNIKEWALRRQPNENPIRGGASNNTAVGISCGLNFTLADDAFLFPNIGFRCCRNTP